MPQFFLDLSLPIRLSILAVIGGLGGAFANHIIYSWCWYPRPISPWKSRSAADGAGNDSDRVVSAMAVWIRRIPIVGWLTRIGSATPSEDPRVNRWFWARPLAIEISLMIALPLYYRFVCVTGGQLPDSQQVPGVLAAMTVPLHAVYWGHAVLIILMTAATFIDFDEQTIPDAITIPGTLIALVACTMQPSLFMPAAMFKQGVGFVGLHPVWFSLPDLPADPKWVGRQGLATALAIWTVWCFALSNRRVITRKGWAKAVEFFFAGLVRYPSWKWLVAMWLLGMPAIGLVWNQGANGWTGLLTALIGLAVGGGVVWAVRIVASTAMGIEAMGFGDVTLMAMIGAFIGWQASLAAFFLSPIAAIAIVVTQYFITRETRVPFGPYLCAGTGLTMVFWDPIYNGYLSETLAILGPVLLTFGLLMFGLLGGMLFVWSLIKRALFV